MILSGIILTSPLRNPNRLLHRVIELGDLGLEVGGGGTVVVETDEIDLAAFAFLHELGDPGEPGGRGCDGGRTTLVCADRRDVFPPEGDGSSGRGVGLAGLFGPVRDERRFVSLK